MLQFLHLNQKGHQEKCERADECIRGECEFEIVETLASWAFIQYMRFALQSVGRWLYKQMHLPLFYFTPYLPHMQQRAKVQ